MEFVSLLHWLAIVGLFYVIFGIPFARILRRVGLSRWWSVLTIIPMINLIGLWTLAYMRWPAIDDAPYQAQRRSCCNSKRDTTELHHDRRVVLAV